MHWKKPNFKLQKWYNHKTSTNRPNKLFLSSLGKNIVILAGHTYSAFCFGNVFIDFCFFFILARKCKDQKWKTSKSNQILTESKSWSVMTTKNYPFCFSKAIVDLIWSVGWEFMAVWRIGLLCSAKVGCVWYKLYLTLNVICYINIKSYEI